MRFAFTSTLIIMAGLTASGSGFVINTFSVTNCGNTVQTDVNIWDNTCATWPNGFKSFKITTWGGSRQKAYFFAPDGCGDLTSTIGQGYVDSTTHDFTIGRYYHFNDASANAIASYSA